MIDENKPLITILVTLIMLLIILVIVLDNDNNKWINRNSLLSTEYQKVQLQKDNKQEIIYRLEEDILSLEIEIENLTSSVLSCESWDQYNKTPDSLLGGFAKGYGYWVWTKDLEMDTIVFNHFEEICHNIITNNNKNYNHFCQFTPVYHFNID